MDFIRVDSLSKRYRSMHALKGCSFRVERGEVLGLLGPNGAGKTTLIRLLLGFLKPTSGSASIDGLDCYRQSVEVHRRLTYLPGDPRLARDLTGLQTLKFFGRLRGSDNTSDEVRTAERLGLDLRRRVAHMSTGMRQKLALSIALSADVPLVVLDEPTSNLDPTARAQVLSVIREVREGGKTVLFSSHVLSEVEEVSDRVVILKAGELVETIAMRDVHRQHRITARLESPPPGWRPEPPESVEVHNTPEGEIALVADGPLEPILGWLAGQPFSELRIEPVGLKAVYQRHHYLDRS